MPKTLTGKNERKEPGVWMSVFVFGLAIAIILVGVVLLSYDIHMVLLSALAFVCLASARLGYRFDALVECMKRPLGQAMPARIIFIFIGIIIAAWIFAGTVPALIFYGLKYITPEFFLPIGLLLCSVVSMSIGTSWGTIGTMGLAMMGIGAGMSIPAPVTAGMVISGAFFGDKMSPISDTTNLAPVAAGTTLHKHIAAMWKTSGPAYLITLALFSMMGLKYQNSAADMGTISAFSQTLAETFNMHPVVLLPIAVLLLLNLFRFPAIPGMAIGSLIGVLIACTVQGENLRDVLLGLNYGYVRPTGMELVDTLLLRGGIQSMMYTFSLACIAISFGGVMEQVGYLHKIIGVVVSRVTSDQLMVPLVISSTTVGTVTMGEVYLSIVVCGKLFQKAFQNRGLKPEMLSRLLEEGGTLTQVFVPWSTSGVFIFATLGVSVAEYWKYALLNYINPLLSIVLALCGIFIMRVKKADQEVENLTNKEWKNVKEFE
jgi:NhaC family Na+:H+ antiporter